MRLGDLKPHRHAYLAQSVLLTRWSKGGAGPSTREGSTSLARAQVRKAHLSVHAARRTQQWRVAAARPALMPWRLQHGRARATQLCARRPVPSSTCPVSLRLPALLHSTRCGSSTGSAQPATSKGLARGRTWPPPHLLWSCPAQVRARGRGTVRAACSPHWRAALAVAACGRPKRWVHMFRALRSAPARIMRTHPPASPAGVVLLTSAEEHPTAHPLRDAVPPVIDGLPHHALTTTSYHRPAPRKTGSDSNLVHRTAPARQLPRSNLGR